MKVTPKVDGTVILVPALAAEVPSPSLGKKPVAHLPEVTLYINYPPTYPSHSPPDFHVSARWMDSNMAPPLSDHLKGLFVPGCPVVYEWVMYLQDDLVRNYSELCGGAMSDGRQARESREVGKVGMSRQAREVGKVGVGKQAVRWVWAR